MLATVFIGVFILLLLLGVPVAYAMGGTAIVSGVFLWGTGSIPFDALAQRLVYGCSGFTNLAVPLFLLAGQLMNGGSITTRIFEFAQNCVGHLPGGLGHVNVLASVIFSGMSGTATADTAGLGTIEIKAMTDAGFDKDFSVAVTGASGLIGPIIPPSVPMVTYGVIAGTSVGALFLGGIIPGLLMGVSMCVLVYIIAKKRNYPRCEKCPPRKFWKDLFRAIPPLMTPVLIIGGIWSGIFTPTEAAGVTVVYALILDMVVYRDLTVRKAAQIFMKVAKDSATILLIIACVSVYGYVLTRTRIPMILAQAIFSITTNKLVILLLLNVFLLIAGCFMSTMESILLLTPVFVPLLQSAHINLVVFGVIMCLNLMIGQLTPPFGMVLFLLTKISELPMSKVVKACLPFMVPVLVVLILCIVFPQIITFIPDLAF